MIKGLFLGNYKNKGFKHIHNVVLRNYLETVAHHFSTESMVLSVFAQQISLLSIVMSMYICLHIEYFSPKGIQLHTPRHTESHTKLGNV